MSGRDLGLPYAGPSPATMIRRVEGLVGTNAIDDQDADFVCALVDVMDAGNVTRLTTAQLDRLRRLHDKHFAG